MACQPGCGTAVCAAVSAEGLAGRAQYPVCGFRTWRIALGLCQNGGCSFKDLKPVYLWRKLLRSLTYPLRRTEQEGCYSAGGKLQQVPRNFS